MSSLAVHSTNHCIREYLCSNALHACYHTSLLLTANLLYKAALQEVVAMQESSGSSDDEAEKHTGYHNNLNAPHPYQLALGILCIQKVLHMFNVVRGG